MQQHQDVTLAQEANIGPKSEQTIHITKRQRDVG